MNVVSKDEGIPLYVQIRDTLRQEIRGGSFKAGEKLPSEDELASRLGVSRMTLRRGLSDLIDEGLIYRRHGVGTFVARAHIQRDHTRLTTFDESAALNGDGTAASEEVLTVEVVPAKLKVANVLSLREGEPVIEIRTVRYSNGESITVHDTFIPYKHFADVMEADLTQESLWDLMAQCGFPVKRAIQKVEAREAEEEIARLLAIQPGAPVLYKERTITTDDGTPVEFTFCYNRGDRYSLTMKLLR